MPDPAESTISSMPSRCYELVTAMTPDAVKLHGLFQAGCADPVHTPSGKLPVDAAVVLHGLAGNCYSSTLNLRLADALTDLGIAVVLGNTRGHDGISMSPVNGRAETIGAAYEIVDDCKQDVSGWVNWLAKRKGHQRVALVGHSLGAIKSLYAQAHFPSENIELIVCLSATRLCHQNFLNSERADAFRKWFQMATDLVQQGRGQELMPVDFPFPTWMCAAAYFDKYGPKDRYDWIPFADQIHVPTLLMFGERELSDNAAFHGLWDQASEATRDLKNYEMQMIASANHFYAGVHHRATEAMQKWICELAKQSE